jgi:hypothetical protein
MKQRDRTQRGPVIRVAPWPTGALVFLQHTEGWIRTPPAIRGRILRAEPDGSWTELASSRQDIRLPVGPGTYRAEVRQVPHHLRPWLGDKPDYDIPDKLIRELPWIYANPITVVE